MQLITYVIIFMPDLLEKLDSLECTEPEYFLRDHVPRHAQHYGISFKQSFDAVCGELEVFKAIRDANFRDLIASGTARKVLEFYANAGVIDKVGERPLIVTDRFIYRMITDDATGETTYFDPLNPLGIGVFSRMVDDGRYGYSGTMDVSVGRPNSDSDLVLLSGFNVDDYDAVVSGFNRFKQAKAKGELPHIDSFFHSIWIPYTLGEDGRHTYDPEEFDHPPVEYTGIATPEE